MRVEVTEPGQPGTGPFLAQSAQLNEQTMAENMDQTP